MEFVPDWTLAARESNRRTTWENLPSFFDFQQALANKEKVFLKIQV